MRTTISIEDGLLEEAKRRARKQGSTLGAVLNEALKVGLLGLGGEKRVDAERPLKTYRGDGLQSGVDLRHSAGLLEVMEEK